MLKTPNMNLTYADRRNARFNDKNSYIVTVEDRWNNTINAMAPDQKQYIDRLLLCAKDEFSRQNAHLQSWHDLDLAQAMSCKLTNIMIDGSMQRQLKPEWVITLLNRFCNSMVVPIQTYQDEDGNILAWDGMHTLCLLWLLATQVFKIDPSTIEVPINLYSSKKKAEMRANFISLNSNIGKSALDLIDLFEQEVYGVRVDNSENPAWIESERKQAHIERNKLFITHKKFGDTGQVGAISRLPEINKMNVESVGWLSDYLAITANNRPAAEKEIMMMGNFFDRCRKSDIAVDAEYIAELASVTTRLFNADFSDKSLFWTTAHKAYNAWFTQTETLGKPRFTCEMPHGMPFLLAQLRKSFSKPIPENTSGSAFEPAFKDLF